MYAIRSYYAIPPVGAGMIAHGTANLIASSYSLYEYESSDGKIELPTSAAGMISYSIHVEESPLKAVMISTMVDMADDIASYAITAPYAPRLDSLAKVVSDIGFIGANLGNMGLAIEGLT